jgi:hypothetical protein
VALPSRILIRPRPTFTVSQETTQKPSLVYTRFRQSHRTKTNSQLLRSSLNLRLKEVSNDHFYNKDDQILIKNTTGIDDAPTTAFGSNPIPTSDDESDYGPVEVFDEIDLGNESRHRSIKSNAAPQLPSHFAGEEDGLHMAHEPKSRVSAQADNTIATNCTNRTPAPLKTTRNQGVQTELSALPTRELHGKLCYLLAIQK